jgi:eukaryotic-like serine/threonine-protein kinase
MRPHTGTTLRGRYRLERQLGSGASATVWRAFDTVLERRVAVKILAVELGESADKLERFRREARALAKLGHPHIVTVIDTGEDEGTPFIVLEYVAGETLKERIRRDGPLPVGEAIAYTIEVARALEAAHHRGIVHRDVKSQNILLDPDGGAKLTDFGIARSGGDDALTQGGRVMGTTDYVSPEQALGHEVTGQSDLYSLGVVLFEALAGAVPFNGGGQLAVATKHVREDFPDVQRRRPEVSATLAAVIDRATAKHLARRYSDAREMVADLERALAIETARAGSASGEAQAVLRTLPEAAARQVPLHVRRRGTIAAGIGVVALVAIAGVLLVLARTHVGNAGNSEGRKAARRPVEAVVSLAHATATAYNPFGTGLEHATAAALVLDGQPETAWSTNHYADGELGKPGVGVFVTLGTPVLANRLILTTPTPGFVVQVWGAQRISGYRAGSPQRLTRLGWRLLGGAGQVGATQTIGLRRAQRRFRYYLVWITKLHGSGPAGTWTNAEVGGIALQRAATS